MEDAVGVGWRWGGSGCGAENAVDTSCLWIETLEEIIIYYYVFLSSFPALECLPVQWLKSLSLKIP